MFSKSLLVASFGLIIFGCNVGATTEEGALLEDLADVSSDELGIPSSFQQNHVMSDEFFTASSAIDGNGLQRFLESTPYNNRSWLADATVNGKRAADAIVEASQGQGINPIVMLARMQVEKSLIAKTSRPSQNSIDYAFGCGCPDNQPCNPAFRGLDRQIECAADTLRKWYDRSVDGTGFRRKGLTFTSLDNRSVTPDNHATASLYAYTPWVFNGGNHLVWQITRLYALHFADQGSLDPTGDEPGQPERAVEVYWARNDDGSYKLHALADSDIESVEYYVDDFLIGASTRADGSNFPATYRFSSETNERKFEVKGYNAEAEYVALGVGLIDVTDGTAVFIRQLGPAYYDIGLDRAPEDVAYIEVSVDGFLLTDETTGSQQSERAAVRYRFTGLGARQVAISTFNADGTLRGTLHREFTFR